MSERVPDDVAATPVERAETEVMFQRTGGEPAEMRPSIEFHRHRDEIDLLLPVDDSPAATS